FFLVNVLVDSIDPILSSESWLRAIIFAVLGLVSMVFLQLWYSGTAKNDSTSSRHSKSSHGKEEYRPGDTETRTDGLRKTMLRSESTQVIGRHICYVFQHTTCLTVFSNLPVMWLYYAWTELQSLLFPEHEGLK